MHISKEEINSFCAGLNKKSSGFSEREIMGLDTMEVPFKVNINGHYDQITKKAELKARILNNSFQKEQQRKSIENAIKKHSSILNNANDSTGYLAQITSLTSLIPGIIEQRYYDLGVHPQTGEALKISDFVPMITTGIANPYSDQYFKMFVADDAEAGLESGLINIGNGQINSVNASFATQKYAVRTWAKSIKNSILEEAYTSANFGSSGVSLMAQKEKTRYRNYQLGRLAMLLGTGLHEGNSEMLGLLNQDAAPNPVTSTGSVITQTFSSMTYTQLNQFLQQAVAAWQANTGAPGAFTPNRLVIGLEDFFGLSQMVSPQFGIASGTFIEVLRRAFKDMTGGQGEILPLLYCNTAYNNLGHNRYVMYRHDDECLASAELITYTQLLSSYTLDGINFQSTAYARFTGTNMYRPNTMLYFDF